MKKILDFFYEPASRDFIAGALIVYMAISILAFLSFFIYIL